jgi:hypothetical protein
MSHKMNWERASRRQRAREAAPLPAPKLKHRAVSQRRMREFQEKHQLSCWKCKRTKVGWIHWAGIAKHGKPAMLCAECKAQERSQAA